MAKIQIPYVQVDDLAIGEHYFIHRYLPLQPPSSYETLPLPFDGEAHRYATQNNNPFSGPMDINKICNPFMLAPINWPFMILALSPPLATIRLIPTSTLRISPWETVLDLSRVVLIKTTLDFIVHFQKTHSMQIPGGSSCFPQSSSTSPSFPPEQNPPSPPAFDVPYTPSPTQ